VAGRRGLSAVRKKLFESTGGLGRQALDEVFEVAIRIVPVDLVDWIRLMMVVAR
jgi:hypothetical protein